MSITTRRHMQPSRTAATAGRRRNEITALGTTTTTGDKKATVVNVEPRSHRRNVYNLFTMFTIFEKLCLPICRLQSKITH